MFDFGARADITRLRDVLRFASPQGEIVQRLPIGQLVKSMISSRTKDAVSLRAYENLIRIYPSWHGLSLADPKEIEAAISTVEFPHGKAPNVKQALCRIHDTHPDFDLAFLGRMPVDQALQWLERLPGVARKVSASVLNFSTLNMPAFVVDTHVLRVLQRLGVVSVTARTETAYSFVMAATTGWSPPELTELHVLTKLLGQAVCHFKNPECRYCPVANQCQYASRHADKLPS